MKLLSIALFISILAVLPLSAGVASDVQGSAGVHKPSVSVPPVRLPKQTQKSVNQASGLVGLASFYGKQFHGAYTASGERFDKDGFTAAHPNLPFGTKVRVTNLRNRRAVVVKINDRGGFKKQGRIIDVSRAAARELGMIRRGVARVKLEIMK